MPSLPNNPHDWALWLFSTLDDVKLIGDDLYRGHLPEAHDFNEIVSELEANAPKVFGVPTNEKIRLIEFHPVSGNVYQTIDQLVGTPINQSRVPDIFTVRELNYTAPEDPIPEPIIGYFHAVQFWTLIAELADHVVQAPAYIIFIESPTRKVELTQKFSATQLKPLPGLEEFSRDFVRTEFHREQKRDIVRSTLIELLQNRSRVDFGTTIERFIEFHERVKTSYAIFAADFSYQKVRSEIEKQNLDDALRLNKTLADIQNQLLALPAALILAAGGLETGKDIKNAAIVIGVIIFSVLMIALAMNQKSSVRSIKREVDFRKELVMKQPAEVASRFEGAFTDISNRVKRQRQTLNGVLWLIAVVVACVAILACYQNAPPKSESVTSTSVTEPLKTPQEPAVQ